MTLPLFFWVLLFVVNVFSLFVFGIDKIEAVNRGRRIPEVTLLVIAVCGPFGAYAGMLLFRHKTRKVKFLLVPIFMFIQLGLLFFLVH